MIEIEDPSGLRIQVTSHENEWNKKLGLRFLIGRQHKASVPIVSPEILETVIDQLQECLIHFYGPREASDNYWLAAFKNIQATRVKEYLTSAVFDNNHFRIEDPVAVVEDLIQTLEPHRAGPIKSRDTLADIPVGDENSIQIIDAVTNAWKRKIIVRLRFPNTYKDVLLRSPAEVEEWIDYLAQPEPGQIRLGANKHYAGEIDPDTGCLAYYLVSNRRVYYHMITDNPRALFSDIIDVLGRCEY